MKIDPTAGPTPGSALLHVGLDLGLAFVSATVLTILSALGLGLGGDVLTRERHEYAIDLRATRGPEVEALLARCREAAPNTQWGLAEQEGLLWVTAEGGAADVPAVLGSHWTGTMRISPGLAVILEQAFDDPLAAGVRLRPMLPAILLGSSLAFLGVGLLAGRRRARGAAPEPPRCLRPGMITGVLAGAILVGVVTGMGSLLALVGLEQQEQLWLKAALDAGGATWGLTVLGVGLLAPLGEEVFFRGHLFPYLRRHAGRGLAYGVTTLLFAAIHMNAAALPSYVVYGFLLAALRERTGSTATCFIAHATVNCTALALQIWT